MHFLASGRRLLFSFVLAGLIGIPLGIVMGLNRLTFQLFDPVIELLRPISGIAWIPLILGAIVAAILIVVYGRMTSKSV